MVDVVNGSGSPSAGSGADSAPGGGGASEAPPSAGAAAELADIRQMMGRRDSDYWKGPRSEGLQARYQELVEAGGAEAAPSSVVKADPERGKEIADLRRMMGQRNSAYWKGPDAERLQARYAALVTGETLESEHPEIWKGPDDVRKALSETAPDLVAAWDDGLGFERHLGNYQQAVEQMIAPMTEGDAKGLLVDFETILPETVRHAVFKELSMPSTGAVAEADRAGVETFASTPEGAALVQQWGGQAGRNLGVLRARLERLRGDLSSSDWETFSRWFDHAPPEQAFAIMAAAVK